MKSTEISLAHSRTFFRGKSRKKSPTAAKVKKRGGKSLLALFSPIRYCKTPPKGVLYMRIVSYLTRQLESCNACKWRPIAAIAP